MPGSSSDTCLRWIGDLRIRLDSSNNSVMFSAGNRTGPPAAALTDIFRKPTTMADAAVDRRCHWAHRVWMLPEPLSLKAGARYRLTLRHGVAGQPDGARVFPASPGGEDAAPGR